MFSSRVVRKPNKRRIKMKLFMGEVGLCAWNASGLTIKRTNLEPESVLNLVESQLQA